MKFSLCILSLFILCLVALPSGEARALSDTRVEKQVAQENGEHCAAVDDDCEGAHPGRDCPPDTDGCGHCHCPGCGASGGMAYPDFFKNTFFEVPIDDWSDAGRALHFCYDAPCSAAHLTTPFQPPRV